MSKKKRCTVQRRRNDEESREEKRREVGCIDGRCPDRLLQRVKGVGCLLFIWFAFVDFWTKEVGGALGVLVGLPPLHWSFCFFCFSRRGSFFEASTGGLGFVFMFLNICCFSSSACLPTSKQASRPVCQSASFSCFFSLSLSLCIQPLLICLFQTYPAPLEGGRGMGKRTPKG
jgi:hypothetical protein